MSGCGHDSNSSIRRCQLLALLLANSSADSREIQNGGCCYVYDGCLNEALKNNYFLKKYNKISLKNE